MTLSIRPVIDGEDAQAFFGVERAAMSAQPAWRPPPDAWAKRLFDDELNPLYRHAEVVRYVAEVDGHIVGRIAAWVDERAPDVGFFGFFDVLPDVEAGRALVWAASDWCRAHGRDAVRGPFDFWAVCSLGLSAAGFDQPTNFALHHGAEHYEECLLAAGYEVIERGHTWRFGAHPIPHPAIGIARATLTNPAIALVPFEAESDEHWSIVGELYASCYVDHRLFFPMEQGELRLIGAEFVATELSFLAFVHGSPAGMSLGLVNSNKPVGRLEQLIVPPAVQRALHRPTTFRQWLYGVDPRFRGRALGHLSTAMYVHLRERLEDAPYQHGDGGWTRTEDTHRSAALTAVGLRRDKAYHVFERRWSD